MNKTENEAVVTSDDQFEDELGWHDLVEFIRRNLSILLGGTLISGVLGLTIAFILPAQWEGNALIRVGQLGNAGSAGSAIEPPLQVVDRIKNQSFQNDVLKSLGISTDEEDANGELFRNTLKVKLEKSELINLSLKGKSPDEVKRHIEAVVNELKNIHIRISGPTINRWNQELGAIEQELKQVNTDAERLAKALGGQAESVNDKNFSQAALLSNVLIAREGELRIFRDRKRLLEERLSPERTFATDVMGRIEASQRPVFPKKSLFTIVGSVMGLFLGVLLSIFRSVIGSRSGA